MPADTSPEAAAVQMEAHREMTGAERLRVAFELSETTRRLALAGLRSRMKGASEEELARALIRLCYGSGVTNR